MELQPLVDILKVFNNPISEEQAWAICFQCSQFLLDHPLQEYFQDIVDSGIDSICVSRHGDILVKKMRTEDGTPVKHGTLVKDGPPADCYPGASNESTNRHPRVIATESHAVQALGTIMFESLDFGIDPSEERALSHELESLIVAMTRSEGTWDVEQEAANAAVDEGIVRDADVEHGCSLQDVIKVCSRHVASSQDAQIHYRAVCRALATEAGELFTFLDRIATSKQKLSDDRGMDDRRLEELKQADWACMWVQVMRSLRQGVLLKKVEHINLPPVEFELTPFEMLLEDIRSRRYTLHTIAVKGDIPVRVRTNAHDVILEFIRSRPPLRKKEQCKRELYEVPPNTPTEFMVQFFACMERKGLLNRAHVRQVVDCSGNDKDAEKMCDNQVVEAHKLKKQRSHSPDLHERLLREIRSKPVLRPVRGGKLLVDTTKSLINIDYDNDSPSPPKQLIKPELSLFFQDSFEESSGEEDMKSHSMTSSPGFDTSFTSRATTPPQSPPCHRAGTFLIEDKPKPFARLQRRHTINVCATSRDRTKKARQPIEYLSLTLEELTHIRSVFTKAELESLVWHPELYQQVSKRKVCFTCRTTKFSLFGEWGTKCQICQRTVCSKCTRKMSVPTDHFRNIPVYSLSPSLLTGEMQNLIQKTRTAPAPSVPQTRASSPSRDQEKIYHQLKRHNFTQPELIEAQKDHISKDICNQSKHVHSFQSVNTRDRKNGSWMKQALKGTPMAICCQCREMVIEIVRSSRQSLAALSLSSSSRKMSTPDLCPKTAFTRHLARN